MNFEDFQTGDHVSFTHSFAAGEFDAFSTLSGDRNRLHHDETYARECGYARAVVPLHMVLAPLSRLAGMIFPGPQSLYLGHAVEALRPVLYGDMLTYTARVQSCHPSNRVLTLSVLAIRGADVVMAGHMTVQARPGSWTPEADQPVVRSGRSRAALITGASGGIGSALALRLARDGWNLYLHYHRDEAGIRRVQDACAFAGVQVQVRAAALESSSAVEELGRWASADPDLSAVLHAASPGVHGEYELLQAVNVRATFALAESTLPRFLARQEGTFVFVSSSAVEYQPAGWESYVAAKVAGTVFVAGWNRRNLSYGVRGRSVLPSYVQTPFSAGLVPEGATLLLPEEVADYTVAQVLGAAGGDDCFLLEPSGPRAGRFGFHLPSRAPVTAAGSAETTRAASALGPASNAADPAQRAARLQRVIREVLRLPPDGSVEGARMGQTPGWDSLRQIELVVAVEREFGVQLASRDLMAGQSFQGLYELLVAKAADKN